MNNKIDDFRKIYNNIKKYDNTIHDLFCIKKELDLYAISIKTPTDISIKNVIQTWHILEQCLFIITNIITEITDKYQTTDKDIIDSYNAIILSYDKYLATYKVQNIILFRDIYEIYSKTFTWDKVSILETVDNLNKYIIEYLLAVPLYTYIIQNIIYDSAAKNINIADEIIKRVELVKNDLLIESDTKYKNIDTIKQNPRLNTFGLTPINEIQTLSEISKKIWNMEINNSSSLKNVATTKKICIIVINNIIKNPIEFTLWKLTKWNIAKDYIQADFTGINKKIIDRMKTIKFTNVNNQKWLFSNDYYGDLNGDEFIVLECLGDDCYRQLSICLYDDIFNISNIPLKRIYVIELITQMSAKKILVNNRINAYNILHENIIFKNMFLPVKIDLNKIKTQSQIVDIALLKYTILNKLIDYMIDLIKVKFKSVDNITKIIHIGELIHDNSISHKFISLFIEQYYEYLRLLQNDDIVYQDEVLTTVLNHMRLLNRNFVRAIHDNYINNKFDYAAFNYNHYEKLNYIRKFLETILITTIDKLIEESDNMYKSIVYKIKLLKLSII